MAYTTPRTWVAGEYPTAAQLNANVRDNVSFLANPPACRVYHNANQTTTTAVHLSLALNSERYDTASMHSTVTNNSRITIPVAGLYLVTGHLEWAAGNTTGVRQAELFLNGLTFIAMQSAAGVAQIIQMTVSTVYKFAAADYVELAAFQNSGVGLNINSSANYSPELAATWIGLG